MNSPQLDHSVLRSSIDVSITGMKQAIHALENGNKEIRNYLFHECNVIYECKVCFNMFRSLANFVIHKRSYCEKQYCDVVHQSKPGDEEDPYRESNDVLQHTFDKVQHPCIKPSQTTVFVIPEKPVETLFKEDTWDINDYAPSLALLQEAGVLQEIEGSPLDNAINLHKKQKGYQINSIAAKLKTKVDETFDDSYYRSKLIRLEKMCQTKNAVFQTMSTDIDSPSMGEQYVDLQKAQQLGTEVIGPDGRILNPSHQDTLTVDDFIAKSLSAQSSPRDNYTLDSSMVNENGSDTTGDKFYACPRCSKEFSSCSNVYRHLVNVHGFTKVGAMRLKSRIIQHRQPKVKKPVVQAKPQTIPKIDVVARSRSSSEVSIAHFSKLDQMRAEECLKNQPTVKVREKSLKREGDRIIEQLCTAVAKVSPNKQLEVLNKKKQNDSIDILRTKGDDTTNGNQNLYINNLYVQVNNFESEDQEKLANEIHLSSQQDQPETSSEYNSTDVTCSNINLVRTCSNGIPEATTMANSSVNSTEKQGSEMIVDSDYESYSPSSRCSRSSRTSNTGNDSENKSSRSSSKENAADSDSRRKDSKQDLVALNDIQNTLYNQNLPNQSKFHDRGSEITEISSKTLSSTNGTSPVETPNFRRNSRTSRRTLTESNSSGFLSLPDTPLEWPGRKTIASNKRSIDSSDSSIKESNSHNTRTSKSPSKSPIKNGNPTQVSNDISNNRNISPVTKLNSPTASSVRNIQINGKPPGMIISTLKEQPSTRTSPRCSRTTTTVAVQKDSDHSMIGTIKARRAINGRNIFQENFYTSPNTRRVRAESQGNTSSTISIPISKNRSKTNDNSMSPLCKRRKLT